VNWGKEFCKIIKNLKNQMCRYATSYKPHYACFNCRKTFKRRLMSDIDKNKESNFEAKCPECSIVMASMGLDFKSPPKNDIKQWEYIKTLYTVGITFHSCGCTGPGYIPNSIEELKKYLEEIKDRYMKNMEFWRKRIEPTTKKEKEKDQQRNWYALSIISENYKKQQVKNDDGIKYWTEKVKEVENRINLIV
jgi:DNA-directed RNA polymerase subunit RPC12/RpoP